MLKYNKSFFFLLTQHVQNGSAVALLCVSTEQQPPATVREPCQSLWRTGGGGGSCYWLLKCPPGSETHHLSLPFKSATASPVADPKAGRCMSLLCIQRMERQNVCKQCHPTCFITVLLLLFLFFPLAQRDQGPRPLSSH